MTPQKLVVVDLDGTLCNSAHREHLAIAGCWDEFHSQLNGDAPWPDVTALLALLYEQDDIVVVGLTGRNEQYRKATINWLAKHDIWLDDILMRYDDDYRSDHELKPQLLELYLKQHPDHQVWFILEDRDKVVEAWRNAGYDCWQVRPGGY